MNWQDQQHFRLRPPYLRCIKKTELMEFYGFLTSKISLMHKQITCLMCDDDKSVRLKLQFSSFFKHTEHTHTHTPVLSNFRILHFI